MLRQIYLRNFILVHELRLDFSAGLNIITGQTGSGKSILIDALRFVFGGRIERLKISDSNQKVVRVEASFELMNFQDSLPENLASYHDEEGLLIVTREMDLNGKSRYFLNGRLAPASLVKDAGMFLIDIHGQYDHQRLLDPNAHLQILDLFAKGENELYSYRKAFNDYKEIMNEIAALRKLEDTAERELDLLRYQVGELKQASFEEGEDEKLTLERIKIANAEKIHRLAEMVIQAWEESEDAALPAITTGLKAFHQLALFMPELKDLEPDLENALGVFEDALRQVSDYREDLDYEETSLLEIDERIDCLQKIKKKYGPTLAEAALFLERATEKLKKLEQREFFLADKEKCLAKLRKEVERTGQALRETRKEAAKGLSRGLLHEMKDLGFLQSQFLVKIQDQDPAFDGLDAVSFMISLNPGIEPASLSSIVSAGEVSRLMLAIKKTLASVDSVPTMIFDEIDANIGGRLGEVTGQKLKELSKSKQIFLITHLPQIASFADQHIRAEKTVKNGTTQTEYQVLNEEQRVLELTEMMSGQIESQSARLHAQELIERNQN